MLITMEDIISWFCSSLSPINKILILINLETYLIQISISYYFLPSVVET